MSVYSALSTIAAEWRSAREEARTRRIVGSLPIEIQKDIGWRDSPSTRQASIWSKQQ
ncbi:hypothetical protein [Mesorhizobium sp. ZC-5]|jgi:hypothetical protein|uniref:hypothetical protein n=1 Tax=Mesorhizobium sp. ZC-5 TaxID=2986066 RepID=UPI0021E82623|nr:hypothetical protein [Mesorhizobium sp. ZC-5]MCV3240921.1 hypothetical protein [Mesorhizobium sp. ZC-5]